MHPVLANNLVGWKRNETVISVSNTGSFIVTHYSNMTNSNITNLIINVTREEFQNKVYTYRCFTHKDNNERIYSNNITVHPPGKHVHYIPTCIHAHIYTGKHTYNT